MLVTIDLELSPQLSGRSDPVRIGRSNGFCALKLPILLSRSSPKPRATIAHELEHHVRVVFAQYARLELAGLRRLCLLL